MTITSPHNETLKEIRKLAGRKWRDKLRQFVAEGEDLLAAADAAGWEPLARLVAEGSGLAGEEVKPHLLQQISQLGSGHARDRRLRAALGTEPTGPLCLALWGVNDPGNVGTALRSALAFGASSVALGPGTADPYGHEGRAGVDGRAVRGARGPGPHGRGAAGPQDRARRPRRRAARAATATTTLVVGAEREGLPDDVVAACDAVATIPVRAESLNAAMAATVALYECNRRMAAP